MPPFSARRGGFRLRSSSSRSATSARDCSWVRQISGVTTLRVLAGEAMPLHLGQWQRVEHRFRHEGDARSRADAGHDRVVGEVEDPGRRQAVSPSHRYSRRRYAQPAGNAITELVGHILGPARPPVPERSDEREPLREQQQVRGSPLAGSSATKAARCGDPSTAATNASLVPVSARCSPWGRPRGTPPELRAGGWRSCSRARRAGAARPAPSPRARSTPRPTRRRSFWRGPAAFAARRQMQPLLVAMEQLHSGRRFQALDSRGDVRRHAIQLAGGLEDPALGHHREEDPQVAGSSI